MKFRVLHFTVNSFVLEKIMEQDFIYSSDYTNIGDTF